VVLLPCHLLVAQLFHHPDHFLFCHHLLYLRHCHCYHVLPVVEGVPLKAGLAAIWLAKVC
jgi:hypothetical protein